MPNILDKIKQQVGNTPIRDEFGSIVNPGNAVLTGSAVNAPSVPSAQVYQQKPSLYGNVSPAAPRATVNLPTLTAPKITAPTIGLQPGRDIYGNTTNTSVRLPEANLPSSILRPMTKKEKVISDIKDKIANIPSNIQNLSPITIKSLNLGMDKQKNADEAYRKNLAITGSMVQAKMAAARSDPWNFVGMVGGLKVVKTIQEAAPVIAKIGKLDELLTFVKNADIPELTSKVVNGGEEFLQKLLSANKAKKVINVLDSIKNVPQEAKQIAQGARVWENPNYKLPSQLHTENLAKYTEGIQDPIALQRIQELHGKANNDRLTQILGNNFYHDNKAVLDTQYQAFGDLDNFGQFNKKYSQAVGDDVLRITSDIAAKQGIEVVRRGGEEFTVYSQLPPEELSATLKNINKEIKSYEYFGANGKKIELPSFTWGIGNDVNAANEAMKAQKEAQRGLVNIHSNVIDNAKNLEYNAGTGVNYGEQSSYSAKQGKGNLVRPEYPNGGTQGVQDLRGSAEVRPTAPSAGLDNRTFTVNDLAPNNVELKKFDPEKYVQEQVIKQKSSRESGVRGILGTVKSFFKDAKAKLVDFNAPIEDVLATAQKKGKYEIIPSEHISNQIDRVLRSPTIAGQFTRDNGIDQVIREVDNLDNLDQYLIAKHSIDVAKTGRETGRALESDRKLVEAFAPRYEEAAKVVNTYSQKLLDYAVDSGLIGKELASELKKIYPNYVPLQRIFSELEKSGESGSRAIASLSKQTVVQKLKGSTREIESPIKSLLEKTADAFKQGEKNKAARMLASYEKLPGNPFMLRELQPGESALHTISFLDKGVKKTFETTKEVAGAAKALNVQQLNILGRIFAAPVRLAKIGITGINLPFVASNIAKDQVTAIINSKNALRTSIANPVVFIKSLFEAVGHLDVYEEMARQGALGTSFDIARNQVAPTIEKIRANRNVGGRILYTVKHPSELLRAVENIVGRSEEFTRIQQYSGTKQAMLAKGMSEENAVIQAAKAARETTVNFARRGEWGQVLNSAFLYLNAGIQGTRTFLRNFAERPIQTAAKLALVGFTPVAAATAWNLSDPERAAAYKDISEYEKQNNIVIIPPHPTKDDQGNWNVIKIPLSQEINNIVSMARRPIEQAYGLNPVTVQDIAKALVGTVSPISPDVNSIASSLTPQAIRPSIESMTNTNLFTGIPIVPSSMEKLSPELQAKPYTSGTARKIGGALNASPLKIEAFIKGTMGGVGSQALNISDKALAKLGLIPKDQIGGQDTIKAIVARFAKARGGAMDDVSNTELEKIVKSQSDNSFLLKQKAESVYATLKKLPKDEANKKAATLQSVDPKLFDKLKSVVESDKAGLDYNDRLLLQLQVNNGERAKFIWQKTKSFSTRDKKNEYISDLQRKGIVSDTIIEQLTELKSKGY